MGKGEEREEERRWKVQKRKSWIQYKERERDERCRKTKQEELCIAK